MEDHPDCWFYLGSKFEAFKPSGRFEAEGLLKSDSRV